MSANRIAALLAASLAFSLAMGCSFKGASSSASTDGAPDPSVDAIVDATMQFPLEWRKRRPISVTPYGGEALSNFPVLVDLESTGIDPTEIRITAADGVTELDIEVLEDPLLVWVKVPSLPGNVRTDLFVYYDNAGVGSASIPEAVWVDEFAGVWHLEETAAGVDPTNKLYADATGNNPGSDQVETGNLAGQVGTSMSLDSALGDRTVVSRMAPWGFTDGGLENGTSSFSISCWARLEASDGNFRSLVFNGRQNNTVGGYWLNYSTNDNRFRILLGNGTTNVGVPSEPVGPLAGNGWHHIVATVERLPNEDIVTFYLDSALVGSDSRQSLAGMPSDGGQDLAIGAQASTGDTAWHGAIDEVAISKVARSADWVTATYLSQNDPATFAVVGAEELR